MPELSANLRWVFCTALGIAFEYDTPKYVHIRNKKIGVFNRLVQLAIIGYIIGYGIVYQHGYEETEPVVSVVTTKVKGADVVRSSSADWMVNCPSSAYNWTILDHTDLVVPPQEPNSFFITTNLWMTCNQTIGICPEGVSVKEANCTSDKDCPPNELLRGGNGITIGECSEDTTDGERTCLVEAWCPVEDENKTIVNQGPKVKTQNFTVLVKNSVSFPQLKPGFHVRNIPADADHDFLQSCMFDNSTDAGKTCPIFSLGQIVGMINGNESYYDELATQGAVVALRITWDCDLNADPKYCHPTYTARRLDNPISPVSPGYNFRYPRYHYVDNTQYRDLVKAYGILFVIQVTGQGRIFSFTSIVLKLGSMIALLAIATTICDLVVLYLFKKGRYYRQKKYQDVDVPEVAKHAGQVYGTMDDSDKFPVMNE